MKSPLSVSDRFWSKVDIKEPDECWNWGAGCFSHGYGNFWDGSARVLAHRFAYIDVKGPIPNGLLVCHKCDNIKCCNPSHLFLGTNADNVRDCARKGRIKGGLNCTAKKFTLGDIESIVTLYKRGFTKVSLSKQFNCCTHTIADVLAYPSYYRKHASMFKK